MSNDYWVCSSEQDTPVSQRNRRRTYRRVTDSDTTYVSRSFEELYSLKPENSWTVLY